MRDAGVEVIEDAPVVEIDGSVSVRRGCQQKIQHDAQRPHAVGGGKRTKLRGGRKNRRICPIRLKIPVIIETFAVFPLKYGNKEGIRLISIRKADQVRMGKLLIQRDGFPQRLYGIGGVSGVIHGGKSRDFDKAADGAVVHAEADIAGYIPVKRAERLSVAFQKGEVAVFAERERDAAHFV